MELLRPFNPPGPAENYFSGFSPPANFRHGFDRATSQLPESVEEGNDKVYVAVGKSVEKAVALLQWAFQRFGNREICILHVHQPSPHIPTLLGKLPANQANGEVVAAYRRLEKEQMKKLLANYIGLCSKSKVKACIITTEADHVRNGIVDLVNEHGIRKLVMGAIVENWMKVKKNSSKAGYAAKNAPSYCEIWFVNKGKLVWTREASRGPSSASPCSQLESATYNLRSRSLRYDRSEDTFYPECLRFSSTRNILSAGVRSWVETQAVQREVAPTSALPSSTNRRDLHFVSSASNSSSPISGSGQYSSPEQRASAESDRRVEEESLYSQLAEVKFEDEASRNEASAELFKRKKLEAEAVEAINKVKAFECAHAHEVELKREAEDALRTTIQEQEKLLEEREATMSQLHQAMRNIALLDTRAEEASRRRDEAAGELKLVQASIATLRHEKQKIQRQKMEAMRWLELWKTRRQAAGANCSGFIRFNKDSTELAEFSLSDLQTATCNFSESFKIGQGGFGCVYKGELMDRTVAIKKLHPHNMQRQSEFQQETQVLGKLQHPHLVTLIGICPEACSLVYEYLPNGSLQHHLSRKNNNYGLNWKVRVRIIAEIASALLFLHSFKPEKVVHGDLKPENILLDSELSCKLCDFGICRLVQEEGLRCPSFRQYTERKGVFPYKDPDFHRSGMLTHKSDIYSFGLIILQLLTGRTLAGLTTEVCKAVSYGKLASILDSSAGDWSTFVARRLVELGLQCSELDSRDRPEITPTLVRELELLHVLEERQAPSFFCCPILQEIMHDPQVAADGFTYEGEALRGWLENGRETSPMTNLKLSHLNLTPNLALRLAIQDWLCKS
ncbi:hypothetical protein RJ640_015628 [Escallonia rubra]|uniref:RING-type E3 ubiquitin transferase n=1 Tax=Escallonia rubra TaxID=112253 RepID=A0AA88S1K1_9ASTE|nr:hypothetical protein RJ640_015626 [Escallonia rubra]KAK2996069.1 hypothetical protein RJ640_015628 [Escallonia rubra]